MNEREMAHRVWLGWFAGGMILGITTGLAMDQPSIGFALHLWACVMLGWLIGHAASR